ncbi:DNA polymerase III subunit delta' [Sphingobium sp. SCG-1]|uniref:AAA family ATPase n=1 Tax=Sphingobium sp. SCG-1 TaxID=2072936 RepID=UPI000CD68218|nr:AAA family ATPase [Sphingobium sp. SCG-1]AUW58587.1 DNA polymerase III subunit delta' [Sphingobium sp. SCG-1]
MTSLIGHDLQARTLLDAARGGRMHHGWILAGPRGVGKASFARMAARRLLAEAAGTVQTGDTLDLPLDNPNGRLFDAGTHPDYAELTRLEKDNGDLARNISVDQVRGLQRLLGSVPSLSNRRIIVIDSADDMERGAANALLKNLEEPPAGTVFLLVAHAPARLLPTIRSRCRVLRFASLDHEALQVILRRHLPNVTADELDALVRAGEGSPGRALGYAGLELGQIEHALAAIAADGDPTNKRRLALAKQLGGKAARPRYEAFLERVPAFLASAARLQQGHALKVTLTGWEQAKQLASGAVILSLDPASVVFELCSYVAVLAQERRAA